MADETIEVQDQELNLTGFNRSILSRIPNKAVGQVDELEEEENPKEEADKDDLADELEEEALKEEKKPKEEKPKEEKPKEEKQEEDSVISFFKTKYGEDIEGEFDESLEGVDTYFQKVLEKEKASSILEGQEQLLETKPIVKALVEHLDAGYGIESFLQQQTLTDWDKIQFKDKEGKEDEKLAEQVFIMARQTRGDSDEEIQDALELAKDKGVLLERAETSKTYLKKIQDKQVADQQAIEKLANDKARKDEEENLKEVEKVLKSGNINGVVIPADKIKELRKFALEADKKGVTERDRKYNSLTTEQFLLLDYIVMNDFKDLGVKPKPSNLSPDAFKKLKATTDAKKKVDLTGNGLSNKERTNINVKSLFN